MTWIVGYFLKKINADKHSTKLRSEINQRKINKIWDEKGDINKIDSEKIQSIIKTRFKNPYSTKLENLK